MQYFESLQITKKEILFLRNCLGLGGLQSYPYKNYVIVKSKSENYSDYEHLLEKDLMQKREDPEEDNSWYYQCTNLGIRAAMENKVHE